MPLRLSKPRDSASLVLIRGAGRGQQVLLGRRPAEARFMPGRYVFPGGMMEPEDRLPSGFAEDVPTAPAGIDGLTRNQLVAFARAALRETLEETGLLVARPQSRPGPLRHGIWRTFGDRRLAPAFAALRLFATAVTPSSYPIRFHARFFLADGRHALGEPSGRAELEAVAWVPLPEVAGLPLPSVTRRVLEKALALRGLTPAHRVLGRGACRLRSWRFA